MDIVAFCESDPDWIQFSNAHVQLQKLRNAYLTFLDRAPLDLLGPSDVLVVVGHGSPNSVGDYHNAIALVTLFLNRGLRNNGATIRFQTCSPADNSQTANPILLQVRTQLDNSGRQSITVQGAMAPSITGWRHTAERVVPHHHLDRVSAQQGVTMFQNRDQIQRAEAYINEHLRPNSTSRELADIARVVRTYTANFFVDFSLRAEPFTVSANQGFVSL